jgi:hypothetical protein
MPYNLLCCEHIVHQNHRDSNQEILVDKKTKQTPGKKAGNSERQKDYYPPGKTPGDSKKKKRLS